MIRALIRCLLVLVSLALVAGTAQAQTPEVDSCRDFSRDECMVSMSWAALTQWADAWSNKDFQNYKNSYSASASPQAGQSREQWLQARKRALSRPGKIKISLNLIDVQYLAPNKVRATVIQRYTAQHYSDIVLKTFHLNLQQGQVKILTEQVDRSLTPQEADTIIDNFGY